MTVQVEPVKKTDEKHKIKVGGEELELTYEELVEHAQKGTDYQRKTQELAEKRKALEQENSKLGEWSEIIKRIDNDPKLRDTLTKVMTDYETGKSSPSSKTLDKNLKLLDKRIEEANDSDVKENLREIRQIISEETESGSLKQEIAFLKEELAVLRNNTGLSISDRIDNQLSKISEKYGDTVIDKYKSEIRAAAARYPKQTAEQLFFYYASSEDREAALLNKMEKEKKKEDQKKTDGSSQPVNTIRDKIEPPRDKRGRVDWNAMIGKLKEKGRFHGI